MRRQWYTKSEIVSKQTLDKLKRLNARVRRYGQRTSASSKICIEVGGDGSARPRKSLQLQNDRALRDGRCRSASFAGVLTDPIPCHPNALVGAGLVLVDGH